MQDDEQEASWYKDHKPLLDRLTPQKNMSNHKLDKNGLSRRKNDTSVSIIFKKGEEAKSLKSLHDSVSRSTNVRLWDMQDAQINSTEVNSINLDIFNRAAIKSDVWMLPVLPENVEAESDSGVMMNEIEKLIAFRTSYQYISLKQKLFFAFEDREEAILLIFGEFLLFSDKDRQIFPTYRFYELLEMMTKPQKERIFTQTVAHIKPKESMFQLRLMFEH